MLRELVPRFEWPLFRPFEREMESMMTRLGGMGEFEPRVNVAETEKEYEVTAELPGMKPEEVHVEMRHGELWISGARKEEKEEKGKTWHRVERRYGEFRRVLALPNATTEGKAVAEFKDGILKVTVPKTLAAVTRHIEVKSG